MGLALFGALAGGLCGADWAGGDADFGSLAFSDSNRAPNGSTTHGDHCAHRHAHGSTQPDFRACARGTAPILHGG